MTPTTSQIRTLRAEAIQSGDYRMAVICTLALNGFLAAEGAEDEPGAFEGRQIEAEGMTQEQALAECAQAIESAAAMQD